MLSFYMLQVDAGCRVLVHDKSLALEQSTCTFHSAKLGVEARPLGELIFSSFGLRRILLSFMTSANDQGGW